MHARRANCRDAWACGSSESKRMPVMNTHRGRCWASSNFFIAGRASLMTFSTCANGTEPDKSFSESLRSPMPLAS